MKDVSRRTVLTGAAWSVPVIALGVTAPAAAASGAAPSVTITGIAYTGSFDWYRLFITVDNIPSGAQNLTGGVTWTPTGGATIGSSNFVVDESGNASITLADFPTGVPYIFTATVRIQGAAVQGSFTYTFS
ncbi:hypothetical protein N1031_17515 [Herbiconiux moechotypicola]|uniref:Ig-like domain-containing protein n=1 Tax=Herbiconiux moechotypicola TaxID=637393 RepID=A0ABN3E2V0_9MICO|nr:hypothetical protein [Herbiconiux moechotypicola]MCS5731562.1 hypothetical protein [Herbiconiux moechotypicola]